MCVDSDAWARVASDLGGVVAPSVAAPAATRGGQIVRADARVAVTHVPSSEWQRFGSGSLVTTVAVDIEKPLPFGVTLGGDVGWMLGTPYPLLGFGVRWAVLEGWTGRDALVPEIAVRAGVRTLLGDGSFTVTVPSLDLTVSNAFVVVDALEVSPFVAAQLAWVFADTEIVDLTPERDALAECNPSTVGSTGELECRGDSSDLANVEVFPSLRSLRARVALGLQLRNESVFGRLGWTFDVARPSEIDRSLPASLSAQWTLDLALGVDL